MAILSSSKFAGTLIASTATFFHIYDLIPFFLLGAVKSQRQGKFKMHLALDDGANFSGGNGNFDRVPVPPNKEKKAGNGWVYKLGWGRRSRILLVKVQSASGCLC